MKTQTEESRDDGKEIHGGLTKKMFPQVAAAVVFKQNVAVYCTDDTLNQTFTFIHQH